MVGNRTIPPIPQMPPPPVEQAGGDDETVAAEQSTTFPPEQTKIETKDPVKNLLTRKGPIEVIALTDGFVAPHRIKKGTTFKVSGPEKLGSWMKCVDKTIQKEHEHYCRAHKKKMQSLDRQSAGE